MEDFLLSFVYSRTFADEAGESEKRWRVCFTRLILLLAVVARTLPCARVQENKALIKDVKETPVYQSDCARPRMYS